MYNLIKEKIVNFCSKYERIYIYGAGVYADSVYSFLKSQRINISGCITTSGDGKLYEFDAVTLKSIETANLNNIGIILSVKEEYVNEIKNDIEDEYNCFIFASEEIGIFHYGMRLEIYKNKFSLNFENAEKIPKNFKPKKLLLIQPEITYGDLIWSSSLIRELYNNYANAEIDMVVSDKFTSLYDYCPYINKVIKYKIFGADESVSASMVKHVTDFVQSNLKHEYNLIIMPRYLDGSYPETIIMSLQCKAKYRIGHMLYFNRWQKIIYESLKNYYSCIICHKYPEHDSMSNLRILEYIGGRIRNDKMEFWIGDKDKKFAKEILTESNVKKYIVVLGIVGSRNSRSWQPEKYVELINRFMRTNQYTFILIGGNDAYDASNIIQKKTQNMCINLVGKTTLLQVGAIISNCTLYVGSDTGLMHIASAFSKPIVEISATMVGIPNYYGSSPTRTGPWRVPAIVLQSFRGLDSCKYLCNRDYHCINQIKVEQVENAINELIAFGE